MCVWKNSTNFFISLAAGDNISDNLLSLKYTCFSQIYLRGALFCLQSGSNKVTFILTL